MGNYTYKTFHLNGDHRLDQIKWALMADGKYLWEMYRRRVNYAREPAALAEFLLEWSRRCLVLGAHAVRIASQKMRLPGHEWAFSPLIDLYKEEIFDERSAP